MAAVVESGQGVSQIPSICSSFAPLLRDTRQPASEVMRPGQRVAEPGLCAEPELAAQEFKLEVSRKFEAALAHMASVHSSELVHLRQEKDNLLAEINRLRGLNSALDEAVACEGSPKVGDGNGQARIAQMTAADDCNQRAADGGKEEHLDLMFILGNSSLKPLPQAEDAEPSATDAVQVAFALGEDICEEVPSDSETNGHVTVAATKPGGGKKTRASVFLAQASIRDTAMKSKALLGDNWKLDLSNGTSIKCMVTSPFFDAIAAFMIIFNSFLVGWEIEVSTLQVQVNPTIKSLSSVCTIFFLLELVLRLAAFRLEFFLNKERQVWNMFDMVLVVLAVVDEVAMLIAGAGSAGGGGAVGSIKMLKMLRIIRIFRVFRFFRQLARLAVMIMDSIKSLLWAMFMLALISYVFAVSLTSQASDWLLQQVDTTVEGWRSQLKNHDDPEVVRVWGLYGSLGRTIYTLSQTALGGVSWHEVCDPLFQVGWLAVLLLLIYISFTVLAVLNVVTGVFVDNAFRSADKQRSDVIQKEIDQRAEYVSQIRDFFHAIDVDDSGEITPAELAFFLEDDTMGAFFRVLGFDIPDPQRFIDLLDVDQSGSVSFDEFVEGCMKFRGTAKAIDVHRIMRVVERIEETLLRIQSKVDNTSRLICPKSDNDHEEFSERDYLVAYRIPSLSSASRKA